LVLRRVVFEPLGMHDTWLAMPRDVVDHYGLHRITPLTLTGSSASGWGQLFGEDRMPDLVLPAVLPLGYDQLAQCWPGTGGYGPARDLATLYGFLLDGRLEPGAVAPISKAEQQDLTRARPITEAGQHLVGGIPAVGFYTDHYPGICSPGTVGHQGVAGGVVIADPVHDLVVAFLPNGLLPFALSRLRQRTVVRTVYEALQQAGDV
jgi:CubicO group peptidase (beta-lactamase class C family)